MSSHASRLAASLARPAIDLRHLLPAVRVQGPRPLCVSFAVTTTHEAARALLGAAAPADPLAVEPLWQHCVANGWGDDLGTTIPHTADALFTRGQPHEVDWPYNDALGSDSEPDPPGAGTVDWHGADMVDVPVAHDGTEDLIEVALAAGFPVVLLAELTHEFEYPDAAGAIAIPPINSPLGDYHAVVAVGAATSPDGSTRRLLIRNSWGPAWGRGGYAWMPLGYLTAFVVEAAVLDPRAMYTH